MIEERGDSITSTYLLGTVHWLLARRADDRRVIWLGASGKTGEVQLVLTPEEWAHLSKPLDHLAADTPLVERDGWLVAYVDGSTFGQGWLGIKTPQKLSLVMTLPEWYRAVAALTDYQYSVIGIGEDGAEVSL